MSFIIDYTIVPYDYSMCIKRECKKAHHCLRQLAEQSLPDHITCAKIILPKYLVHSDNKCDYYRSDTKVRYAKGFINMLGDIPQKDAKRIIDALKNHYGYRTYYRMRKGERLMSPIEQNGFKSLLTLNNFIPIRDFDTYEENYLW